VLAAPLIIDTPAAAAAAVMRCCCCLVLQGGLTWLWLDAPYVITARKLFNWALEANNKGDVFPVSPLQATQYCQTQQTITAMNLVE
jgi:hypothetical protein